jgi:hypothetical protein
VSVYIEEGGRWETRDIEVLKRALKGRPRRGQLFKEVVIRITDKEAVEIELHSNSMNREGGFSKSRSWMPLIFTVE